MTGLLISMLLAASPALPKVAAPDWSLVKIDPALGNFYADHFSGALRTQGFQVVTSKDISALLGQERQKQLLGCSDESTSCLTELGNALGCDGMLLVSLAKLDQSYRGNARIVSSTTAKVLAETTVEASSESGLLPALDDAAVRLAAKFGPAEASSVRSKSWVPALLGGVGLGVGIGGLVAAGSRADALKTKATLSGEEVATLVNEGTTWQTVGLVAGGVGVAALITAGVMFLVGGEAPKVSASVTVNSTGATVGIGGSF